MKVITVIRAIRVATRPSSSRPTQPAFISGLPQENRSRAGTGRCVPWTAWRRGLLVVAERRLDQVGPDVLLELLPDRLHGLAPGGDVFLGQRLDLGLAGFLDALAVALVELVGQLVRVRRRLRHRLRQALADVGR